MGTKPLLHDICCGTLVTEGQSPAYVNLLLAVDSDRRGQRAVANRYLLKADELYQLRVEELMPPFPAVIASVSRFFVNPPPRPKDGMELVNLGLRVWPTNPDSRLARERRSIVMRNGWKQ